MKKLIIASLAVGLIIVSLGTAGLVYAQTQPPDESPFPFWGRAMPEDSERPFGRQHRMMGFYQSEGIEPGMVGGFHMGTPGLMHEYMLDAFAGAVGLTPEQVQERLNAGETRWEIAQSQGFGEEDIQALMFGVHSEVLQDMVADGVISQEQADLMLERKAQMYAAGFGSGNCHGEGVQGRFGGGRGPRGN